MASSLAHSPDPAAAISVPWSRVERFVGLLSHDLRNGLNALELQLTYLGEISDDPDAKAEVKRMRGSLADLTRQLQAVRVATSAPAPHLFPYAAADFIEDLRDRFDREHAEASTRVRWEIEPGSACCEIDPELSIIALLELLSNALGHTPDAATVRFHAVGDAASLTLSLHHALTAAPAEAPRDWGRLPLFSSRRDGYGLGTFRARRIIESQHGTLDFVYAERDQSLVTTVVLPVARATGASE